jgi:hypothetical protein
MDWTRKSKNYIGVECRGQEGKCGWMKKVKSSASTLKKKMQRTENRDGGKFLWDEGYLLYGR